MNNLIVAMPKYEAYKDSGVEWLGEIPEHWSILRFIYQFNFSKGLTITKENLQDYGIPCANYGEIHSKYGFELNPDIHPLKFVSEDYRKSSYKSLLFNGDFIFADTSEDIEGSGNFTYLNSEKEVFAGYHTVIARPVKGINYRFLAYVCDSRSFRSQVRRKVKGVKVYSITKSILKNTFVWFPPIKEQITIANFLDQKNTQIDQAIAIKEKQINLLKERKQILIQNAVTHGLNPDAPMRDSGVEWIGEIPEHWDVAKIGHYGKVTNGSTPSRDVRKYWNQGTIPWVSSGKVNDFVITTPSEYVTSIALKECSLKVYPKDTILIGIVGQGKTRGTSALLNIEASINQNLAAIVPAKNIVPSYLHQYLVQAYEKIRNYGKGSNQEALNCQIVSSIKLTVPPFEEQKLIVAYLDSQSSKINKAITLQNQQIKKLKEYKTTLINSAVTGKIKISIESKVS